MPEWDAEVVVDEQLVRALLAEQFPELDASSARLLGEGWDNSVWLVEGKWALRFPRRATAIPGVLRELDVLPRLAPLLPVSIPVPRFVGVPSDRFPWPFFGGPILRGRELAEAELPDDDRAGLAADLGAFLRVLHGVQLEVGLPMDPLGRADMTVRVPRARQCLEDARTAGIWGPRDPVDRILASALELPRSDEAVVVHGDLHLRHVLVDDRRLAAVIDWGDVCVGDPSIDLQLLWCLFPSGARESFTAAYGAVEEHRLLRARATALYFCAMLATYAHSVGNAPLMVESVAGLERTLTD